MATRRTCRRIWCTASSCGCRRPTWLAATGAAAGRVRGALWARGAGGGGGGGAAVSAEACVQDALLSVLRADAAVTAIFGPRIYDDESEAPALPYLRVERHECRPAGASLGEATEHVFALAVSSRDGGLR